MSAPIMAAGTWATNADMIADVAQLGYLRAEWRTLDPTWGLGTWWTTWRPDRLVGGDLDPTKSPTGRSVDATCLPYGTSSFDAVVLDPPYKLNGTPTDAVDERYGVGGLYTAAVGRHRLMADMLTEAARVASRVVLMKCQDQVCSGRVHWQTDLMTAHAATAGLVKVDALLFPSYRPQPSGRSQQHARRNYSTLLVFAPGGVS